MKAILTTNIASVVGDFDSTNSFDLHIDDYDHKRFSCITLQYVLLFIVRIYLQLANILAESIASV